MMLLSALIYLAAHLSWLLWNFNCIHCAFTRKMIRILIVTIFAKVILMILLAALYFASNIIILLLLNKVFLLIYLRIHQWTVPGTMIGIRITTILTIVKPMIARANPTYIRKLLLLLRTVIVGWYVNKLLVLRIVALLLLSRLLHKTLIEQILKNFR